MRRQRRFHHDRAAASVASPRTGVVGTDPYGL